MPGLAWAISTSRFQVRRFDCSFIFTYPVQTSVGRTCCCWLLSLLILSVPRVLLDSPGPSRALPTRSAPVCVLLPRSIRFVAPSSQARSSRRPSRFGPAWIAIRPRVLHESGSCAGTSAKQSGIEAHAKPNLAVTLGSSRHNLCLPFPLYIFIPLSHIHNTLFLLQP